LAKLQLEKAKVDLQVKELAVDEEMFDDNSKRLKIEAKYKYQEADLKLPSKESRDGRHNEQFVFSWTEERYIFRNWAIPFFLLLANALWVQMPYREMTLFIMADIVCLAVWWEIRKKAMTLAHVYHVHEPHQPDNERTPCVQPELARLVPHKYPAMIAHVDYSVEYDAGVMAWLAGYGPRTERLTVSRTMIRHAQSAFTQNYDDTLETISGRLLRAMQRLPINIPAGEMDDGRAIYRDSHRVAVEWVKHRIQSELTPNYGPVARRTI
jgi:hypothetical protein